MLKSSPGLRFEARRTDRIRIGYYSADFYSHATAHLTAQLLDTRQAEV